MTSLYRHFSADGTLLYLGIAQNASWRQVAHAMRSGWFRDVRTITVSEPYPSRQAALAAEAAAIKAEKPRYNTQHAPTKPVDVPIHPTRQGAAPGLTFRVRRSAVARPPVATALVARVAGG